MTVKEDKIVKYNEFVRETKESMFKRDIYKFCVAWANKMEEKILNGAVLADIAKESERECYEEDNTLDITGSMYPICVSLLSDCWIYGDELRNWHNQKYGYTGEGVVNNSVITVSK